MSKAYFPDFSAPKISDTLSLKGGEANDNVFLHAYLPRECLISDRRRNGVSHLIPDGLSHVDRNISAPMLKTRDPAPPLFRRMWWARFHSLHRFRPLKCGLSGFAIYLIYER